MRFGILILLLFAVSSTIAEERNFICSDKIYMDFLNSTINERGTWIDGIGTMAKLSFNIDDASSLFVLIIKNENEISECQQKEVAKDKVFYIGFNPQNKLRSLTAFLHTSRKHFVNDKREVKYMFVVLKIVNGESIYYFKNFTFNVR